MPWEGKRLGGAMMIPRFKVDKNMSNNNSIVISLAQERQPQCCC
jgi:hypothetical protein